MVNGMRKSLGVTVIFGAMIVALLAGCSYLAPRPAVRSAGVDGEAVVFRFYAPTARRVQLAGDWPGNNWAKGDGSVGEANVGLMSDANGNGVWEIRVELEPGRYRYLFWVDETTWHLDPENPEEVEGGPARKCSQLVLHENNGDLQIR
jgi:hypothetical protein